MTDCIYNFSAGPAVLPESVLQQASTDLHSLNDSGIGVLEHSHRSSEITEVFSQAKENCRNLADIPSDYEILFLQGGASSQFFMIPMNLLQSDKTADYINTGAWSQKAIKEASMISTVHIAGSSESSKFDCIPTQLTFSKKPQYVHFTSNNTIYGTQWQHLPQIPSESTLVCDASSDLFSRPINVASHGIIYAGAQKNLGPAGVTMVIIKNNLIDLGPTNIPTMLQYRTHVKANSMYNTPPVFCIYVVGLVLQWAIRFGGLIELQKYNEAKATMLYDFLDNSDFYTSPVKKDSRSMMNICFKTSSEALDAAFIAEARNKGLSGLKGHRSVGGMRASVYNAFPEEGVSELIEFMKSFEKSH